MKLVPGNLFESIPEIIDQELMEDILSTEKLTIKRIISKGQFTPASGWYDQEDNEWVVVISGEGKVSFKSGDIHHLVAGSYLNIPAHTKHQVLWTSPVKETIWLAIHY